MSFLLDTNICSAHMRRPGGLAHRFMQFEIRLAIPTVALAELYAGAYRHPNPAKLLFLIEDLLREVSVLDFDADCAEQFGKLRGALLQHGMAVALVHDLTLVTHNTVDFRSIPNLRLEDWLVP